MWIFIGWKGRHLQLITFALDIAMLDNVVYLFMIFITNNDSISIFLKYLIRFFYIGSGDNRCRDHNLQMLFFSPEYLEVAVSITLA
jgi:hypothetical protein